MESTAGRGAECKIQTPFQHFEQSVNGLVSGLRGICAGISVICLFLKTHKLPFDGKSRHFAEFLPVRTFPQEPFHTSKRIHSSRKNLFTLPEESAVPAKRLLPVDRLPHRGREWYADGYRLLNPTGDGHRSAHSVVKTVPHRSGCKGSGFR